MVKIFIDEKEVRFQDWTMQINNNSEIMLTVQYFSGKRYTQVYNETMVSPVINRVEDLLYNKKSKIYKRIESVKEIGEKYLLITFIPDSKVYLMKCEDVELYKSSPVMSEDIWCYFKSVAQERIGNAKTQNDKIMAQNIFSQFTKIIPTCETALQAYLTRKIRKNESPNVLIYPFGVNETQMEAVKKAFMSQISIIEGPPGTGKTQTILNIISNIIINKKTCAIVSNNNLAVENVYEKLDKKNLGFLIARLGNTENRENFFKSINYDKSNIQINDKVELQEIKQISDYLEEYMYLKNRLAIIISEIQEIETEKKYLLQWNSRHPEIKADNIYRYKLDYKKTVDLMTYLIKISEKALTLRDKWELLIQYRIFKSKFLNNIEDRESFIYSLQITYYDKLLIYKNEEKDKVEQKLKEADFDNEIVKLQNKSLEKLYYFIIHNFPDNIFSFTNQNYRQKFAEFVKCFPIIGSSTHSLISSVAEGFLFDYVIVDEASQQDLIPGILCFGCAKNVIIVGDTKQLSHIKSPSNITSPGSFYDCMECSLLDSVCLLFKDEAPRTLLKEHYRCHPKIIQFCNQQFYNNQLIPMTVDKGEEALSLIITAPGNHMRNYKNQREIESVLSKKEDIGFLGLSEKGRTVGFIAPYNKQIDLADDMMPEMIVKNTIHKFQGRECDLIIFSTVLDKKKILSQRQIDFVDNAPLVNVAVSRAKNEFVLVTGKDVFAKNNKYIAALVRYIQYYAPETKIYDSPVISAFDLLYSEYDKSLERLAKKLKTTDSKFKSEQIMAAILREVLEYSEFNGFVFHTQIFLKQLVLSDNNIFSDEERIYIKNRASCDFVIYYRIGKNPFAVIEVDGGYHDTRKQMKRDELKNSILEKAKIPLLRLRTTDIEIKKKTINFFKENMNDNV